MKTPVVSILRRKGTKMDKDIKIQKLEDENAALKCVLKNILKDLPVNRDWLDPNLERIAKEFLK